MLYLFGCILFFPVLLYNSEVVYILSCKKDLTDTIKILGHQKKKRSGVKQNHRKFSTHSDSMLLRKMEARYFLSIYYVSGTCDQLIYLSAYISIIYLSIYLSLSSTYLFILSHSIFTLFYESGGA
jgi:hypothetical protein